MNITTAEVKEKKFTKENGVWTIYPYQKQSEIIKSYKELNVFETTKDNFSKEFVVNSNHIGFGPISFEEKKTEAIVSKQIVERLHNFGYYPEIEIVFHFGTSLVANAIMSPIKRMEGRGG